MVDENKVKEADYKVVEPTKEQLEAKGRMVTAMEEINKVQEKYQTSLVINSKYVPEGMLIYMSMVDIKQPETAKPETKETVADKIK